MKLGFLYALLSGACFAGMGFLVRLNAHEFSTSQQVFVRSLVSCALLLPFCYREITSLFHISAASLWLRSASGASSVWCYFYALGGTSTANANLLYSSAPIFVCLFSFIFKSEKLHKLEALGIFLIVVGNIILYLPSTGSFPFKIGLIGSLGAFLAGIAMFSLSDAAKKHSPHLIVFSFSLACGVIGMIVPSEIVWHFASVNAMLLILSMGIFGLAAQLTLTYSFVYLPSPMASALARSAILWGALIEIIAFKLHPNYWEWLSYTTVLLGIFALQVWSKLLSKK